MAASRTFKVELARHRTALLVIVVTAVLLLARARLAAGQGHGPWSDFGASCPWEDEEDDWFEGW